MTRALGPASGTAGTHGLRVELETAPRLVVASVLAPEGNVVSSGRMGLGETYAVADQIVTDERHRRLGLGTVVMAALERHALEAGLERAVLGATGDGRGRSTSGSAGTSGAPLTAVYYRPGLSRREDRAGDLAERDPAAERTRCRRAQGHDVAVLEERPPSPERLLAAPAELEERPALLALRRR